VVGVFLFGEYAMKLHGQVSKFLGAKYKLLQFRVKQVGDSITVDLYTTELGRFAHVCTISGSTDEWFQLATTVLAIREEQQNGEQTTGTQVSITGSGTD
jgi:hypothetical protein